jgi:ABC-type multidrug transport system ATPase subunit
VFNNLSLGLGPGVNVILGPNGAGKSTLLGLAAGALRPQDGRVLVGDVACGRSVAARRRFGRLVAWLPQRQGALGRLSAREQVAYVGWLGDLPSTAAWDRSRSALRLVGLEQEADTPARHLSGGQLRRVGIAAALVRDVKVLLLDEPMAGLDPLEQERFAELLVLLGRGRTVVLSTHDLAVASRSAETVSVLHRGRLLRSAVVGGAAGARRRPSPLAGGEAPANDAPGNRMVLVRGVEESVFSVPRAALAAAAAERRTAGQTGTDDLLAWYKEIVLGIAAE